MSKRLRKLTLRKRTRQFKKTTTDEESEDELGYKPTLMYGQYTQELASRVKKEHELTSKVQKFGSEIKPVDKFRPKKGSYYLVLFWKRYGRTCEDWILCAMLGLAMAIISLGIDFFSERLVYARVLLFKLCSNIRTFEYMVVIECLVWIGYPTILILMATVLVKYLAPQAAGSGIPEMKTILRGFPLKEYLTLKVLVAKVFGLTLTLGSGLCLGKEGPFVHIACVVANLMNSLLSHVKGIETTSTRKKILLAVAAAVGVASCFGAPVGGVLFSIEVTAVSIPRNYWLGFFGAVWGAIVFHLFSMWSDTVATFSPLYETAFEMKYPFDATEMLAFAGIGIVCGVGGGCYVMLHRWYVDFMRSNKCVNNFLQRYWFIYPTLVTLFLALLTFPPLLGQFHAGILGTKDQIDELFSNVSWTKPGHYRNISFIEFQKRMPIAYIDSVFTSLTIYTVYNFMGSILASTLPVPTGIVIPTLKAGASFGRMIGEAMMLFNPQGIGYGYRTHFVVPGAYAVVGAASFTGAVTRTLSITMIVVEMTGQSTYIIPVLISVLVSNAVSSMMGPSFFDSMILIKKLPYLPSISPACSTAESILAKDFMETNIKYIWQKMTFEKLKDQLKQNPQLRNFPLVDSTEQMILLGSIQRGELTKLLQHQLSSHDSSDTEVTSTTDDSNQTTPPPKLMETTLPMSRFEVTLIEETKSSSTESQPSNQGLLNERDVDQETLNEIQVDKEPKKSTSKRRNSFHAFQRNAPKTSSGPKVTNSKVIIDPQHNTVMGIEHLPTWKDRLQSIVNSSRWTKNSRSFESGLDKEDFTEWEIGQLNEECDFTLCRIDLAPSQIVDKTSLLKVHTLFALEGLRLSYVTSNGRLVGVVGLDEIKKGIEAAEQRVKATSIEETTSNDIEAGENTDDSDLNDEVKASEQFKMNKMKVKKV